VARGGAGGNFDLVHRYRSLHLLGFLRRGRPPSHHGVF
jgi:hypothetical protein